ncbi:MAG: 4-hydroxy-tetrahydrodipicolinate synthase [Rhodospirillaceae bacterium]|nr:4-hydroxy-tetrahydrodipicolinate synthase [Rhodospirillaceae bacterium]|tara:strand:- start:28 stop:900 length:873 start_codon:yes stop_codon:yes gene_type:complete
MFKGSICALITPFRDGSIDKQAYINLINWQIEQGTQGLVPCGTTGESPTLSHKEHMLVVELCVKTAAGRVPVIAGAGSNSTEEALMLTKHAKEAGADGALVVTPYYNKPTQEGLFHHFKTLSDNVDIPIVIYNIPSRSVIDMSVDTMERLAKLENILGVKDATNDVSRATRQKMVVSKDFSILSGEDGTQLGFLAQGGHGCISVTANVAPGLMARFHSAWIDGDVDVAQSINEQLMPLHKDLFCETNPAPVKYALSLLGKCTDNVRLPIVPVSKENRSKIKVAMRAASLI